MPGSTRRRFATLGVYVAAVAVSMLAIVSVGTLQRRSALERFVAEVGPIEPERYAPEPLADSENAATRILVAAESMRFRSTEPGDDGDLSWIRRCAAEGPGSVPAWNLREVRAAISDNAAALEALERAVPLKRANWNIDYAEGLEASLPLRILSGAVGALACDGRLAISERDFDRASRRIAALGGVVRALQEQPGAPFLTLGCSFERTQLAVVRDLVGSPGAPVETLVAIESSFSRTDLRERWRASIALGAACAHRSLERRGMPPEYGSGIPFEHAAHRAVWFVAGEGWLAYHLRRTAELARVPADAPLIECRARAPLGAKPPWWSRWLPDLTRFDALDLDRVAATTTQRALARRALTLRLAAARGGAYPPALDPPPGPSEDPFSGRPFTWTVADDGSAVLGAPVTAEFAARTLQNAPAAWWTWELPPPRRDVDKRLLPTRLPD